LGKKYSPVFVGMARGRRAASRLRFAVAEETKPVTAIIVFAPPITRDQIGWPVGAVSAA
jgi:hypothetical protein